MAAALKSVEIVRVRDGRQAVASDRAAAEEPLEVRLHGRPFAVIMRTPGADRELAAGFLFAERVIRNADDLGAIAHCTDPVDSVNGVDRAGRTQAANVINVTLTGRTAADLDRLLEARRQTATNSSCGLCGRQTIASLWEDVAPLAGTAAAVIPAHVVLDLPERLRAAQSVFDETGGIHAAGLFDADGALLATAEDVGRHNAVDKVIGRMLMEDALPLSDRLLFVSGRTSFEIVQKALYAGISVVASVSAPSSLAIELAQEARMTLIGFVRGDSFNIYSHPGRIR